jgi:pilus assembly protein Flp/PilA
MIAIRLSLRRLRRDKRGATAIEYGLIVALIGVAIMGALSSLGGGVGGMWTKIDTAVP